MVHKKLLFCTDDIFHGVWWEQSKNGLFWTLELNSPYHCPLQVMSGVLQAMELDLSISMSEDLDMTQISSSLW